MKTKIIVPTDLTRAADQAILQAISFARLSKGSITLLHVLDEGSKPSKDEQLMAKEAEFIRGKGIICEQIIKEGSIFDVIPRVVSENEYSLMVIGTHGIRGLKQLFFGSDILKLVEKLPLPTLVVQENSPVLNESLKILLPVSSHDPFSPVLKALTTFSAFTRPEVHLYSVRKPGYEWPPQLLLNLKEAESHFHTNGIRMVRVKEEQNVYSAGYAKQTLNYAYTAGAEMICMMSQPSDDYYFFAHTDKEQVLLNEHRIPVLCCGGSCN